MFSPFSTQSDVCCSQLGGVSTLNFSASGMNKCGGKRSRTLQYRHSREFTHSLLNGARYLATCTEPYATAERTAGSKNRGLRATRDAAASVARALDYLDKRVGAFVLSCLYRLFARKDILLL